MGPRESYCETLRKLTSQTCITPSQSSAPTLLQQALIRFHQVQHILFQCYVVCLRSPTMRHISRTHRVALDWCFARMNLDPKIQIKYVDTEHQLADILTKGNFTRDEWNNLLHLSDNSHFSLICWSQNFRLTSCSKTMAKTM